MPTADKLIAQLQLIPVHNRTAVLLTLVFMADVLVFRQPFGINLFLFAIAVSAGILLSARRRVSPATAILLLGFSAIAAMPLVVTASLMGIGVGIFAVMCVALAGAGLMPARLTRLPMVLLRFLLVIPLRIFEDSRKHFVFRPRPVSIDGFGSGLRVWAMPLVLASIFLILFAMANPLVEAGLRNINYLFKYIIMLRFLDFWRIGFWMLAAICIWAMLRPRLKRRRARRIVAQTTIAPVADNPLLGEASLLRSLLVFNAMFGIQTLLDMLYLWGGANLPDGMSHAEYAHRGAYPLIATALLAGAFVLATMRSGGPGDRSPVIRGLVHVWIAQNILLCLSAILRLDLYVEVYSLTELRVAAGIWMGLVGVGLALILLRILLRRSNEWLIATNLGSLVIVLYVTAFIDIPAFIARFNVEHSFEVAHQGLPLDIDYLRSLGPSAIPALDVYLAALPRYETERMTYALVVRNALAGAFLQEPGDWRSWSFRTARLSHYLGVATTIAE